MSSSMAPQTVRAAAAERGLDRQPPIRRVVKAILRLYLRPFHGIELLMDDVAINPSPEGTVIRFAKRLGD